MGYFTISKTTLTIIIILWSLTLVRSIVIMFGKKVFKDASMNENSAIYPIINLFSMLEALNISAYLGILLFVPVLNLIVLLVMSIKLGQKYNCDMGLKLGLICLPIIFYPVLFNSGNSVSEMSKETFLALDSAKSESINLMTEEEIKKENDSPYDLDPAVDSIFKSDVDMMEPVEAYRATKLDQDILDKLKDLSMEDPELKLEKNENVSYFDLDSEIKRNNITNDNKFTEEIKKEEDIEFIDL